MISRRVDRTFYILKVKDSNLYVTEGDSPIVNHTVDRDKAYLFPTLEQAKMRLLSLTMSLKVKQYEVIAVYSRLVYQPAKNYDDFLDEQIKEIDEAKQHLVELLKEEEKCLKSHN